MARLLDRYRESIRPELQRDLGLGNLHEVPRLEKVVVNVGIGAALSNDAIVDHTVRDIAAATGQRPDRDAGAAKRGGVSPARGPARGREDHAARPADV